MGKKNVTLNPALKMLVVSSLTSERDKHNNNMGGGCINSLVNRHTHTLYSYLPIPRSSLFQVMQDGNISSSSGCWRGFVCVLTRSRRSRQRASISRLRGTEGSSSSITFPSLGELIPQKNKSWGIRRTSMEGGE
jgi:hypothetical protein